MSRRAAPRGRVAAVVLALVLLVAGAYLSLVGNGFINYDDGAYIGANPFVNCGLTLRGVSWAFTTDHMGNWHPLTWLSHMVDVELFGVRPGGHHAVSLLFHVANTLLHFVLLRTLTGAFWRSFLVAALFGLHPLHVESVAWAAERKDVLSALFALLALVAWYRYLRRRATVWYAATALLYALSLSAKPMYVTLPFVMLLLDWWPLGRWSPDRWTRSLFLLWREKLPLLALSAASVVVTLLFQSRSGAMISGDVLPLQLRTANALVSYGKYVGMMVWPSGLAIFYPYPERSSTMGVWGGVLLLIAGTYVSLHNARRQPFLVTGWLWYVGTLVPVIGIVQVGAQSMADRYTYLSLTGLFVVGVWVLADVARNRPGLRHWITSAVAAALLILSVITRAQVSVWHDDFSLYRQALRVTERNWMAHTNLGNALAWTGKTDEAMVEYQEALKIVPDDPMALNNVALMLKKWGRIDEAIAAYRRIVSTHPQLDYVHCNLGLALAEKGLHAEALSHYRRALEINPAFVSAMNNVGRLFYVQEKYDDAILWYRQALAVDPRHAEARFNLGLVLAARGNLPGAAEQLREAARLNPAQAAAFLLLGDVLTAMGRLSEARVVFEQALAANPQLVEAKQRLEHLRR